MKRILPNGLTVRENTNLKSAITMFKNRIVYVYKDDIFIGSFESGGKLSLVFGYRLKDVLSIFDSGAVPLLINV